MYIVLHGIWSYKLSTIWFEILLFRSYIFTFLLKFAVFFHTKRKSKSKYFIYSNCVTLKGQSITSILCQDRDICPLSPGLPEENDINLSICSFFLTCHPGRRFFLFSKRILILIWELSHDWSEVQSGCGGKAGHGGEDVWYSSHRERQGNGWSLSKEVSRVWCTEVSVKRWRDEERVTCAAVGGASDRKSAQGFHHEVRNVPARMKSSSKYADVVWAS